MPLADKQTTDSPFGAKCDPFAHGILNRSFFLSGLEVMNGNGIVWGKAQDPHAIGRIRYAPQP